METLKATLFTNWNFMRLLRLGIGAWVMVQSFMLNDTLMMFFGAFFVFQAVTNTGCCGVQSCAAPMVKNDNKAAEEIEYEEIKQK